MIERERYDGPASDELVERVARAMVEPLGWGADVPRDWEKTLTGYDGDSEKPRSLAEVCRSLARAALATAGESE